jgi:hypothetical protein
MDRSGCPRYSRAVGFLRRKDERAIPKSGTPEFEEAVRGSAIPDSRSVSMGEAGWTDPSSAETIDLRGTGTGDQVEEVLREHGIDPDKKGQTIDASKFPGLRTALFSVLVRQVPNADGIGGGVSTPKKQPPKVDRE